MRETKSSITEKAARELGLPFVDLSNRYKLCVLIVKEDDHAELMITEAAEDFTFSPPMNLDEIRSFYEEAVKTTIAEERRGTEAHAAYIGLPVDVFRSLKSDVGKVTPEEFHAKVEEAKERLRNEAIA